MNRYTISVHHDLRPHRLWPYWATMTVGIGCVEGVWRARTREGLIAKCERWIKRDSLGSGYAAPTVNVLEYPERVVH